MAADRVLSMQRLARVHGIRYLEAFYTEAREGNERTPPTAQGSHSRDLGLRGHQCYDH